MGVSILTYNGQVQFGLMTDSALVPDPEQVINRFGGGVREIVAACVDDGLKDGQGLCPWTPLRD